jgi:Transposase DDE domain.
MKSGNIKIRDLDVFIGSDRIPVRLVLTLLNDDIYESKVRKREQKNKHIGKQRKSKSKTKGYKMSDKFKDRAHFNLFITNIKKQEISNEEICNLYSVRWQVELIFKIWKSIMKINCLGKMNYHRLMTTLYMNLLWIIVHWSIIFPLRNYLYKKEHSLLSVFKCMNTLKEHSREIRQLVRIRGDRVTEKIDELLEILSRRHWLEHVKNKRSFDEIFPIINCKLIKYRYL